MSSPLMDRSKLLHLIVQTLERELSAATLLFHSALAERLQLNMTDYKALEAIYQQKGLSAGELAEYLHVTPGAITGIADRLERGGFVQRIKGAVDRRQVTIMPIPERQGQVQRLYDSMGDAMLRLTERYTDQELRTIHNYLQESIRVVQTEAAKVLEP
jgi:DNA-binding MarR family transcriptional regulator